MCLWKFLPFYPEERCAEREALAQSLSFKEVFVFVFLDQGGTVKFFLTKRIHPFSLLYTRGQLSWNRKTPPQTVPTNLEKPRIVQNGSVRFKIHWG